MTGSSGWLGRHLAHRFKARGDSVIGLDVSSGVHTDVVGSIADPRFVEGVFSEYGIEAVVHAATLHKPDIARHSASRFVEVNVRGTLNLLEAAVRAGHEKFVFTSTTSLMISASIRAERGDRAVWLDRDTAPLEPRNIYGVTKLAAENLCRMVHLEQGLSCVVLRTARFFPEGDDLAHRHSTSGENTKTNEFLHRRLTVADAADAHLRAFDNATDIGFGVYVVSSPPPFSRDDLYELKQDAASVISRYFPDASELYARRGWVLPTTIGRVYDPSHAELELGFRCRTDFAAVLDCLRRDAPLPFAHDTSYFTGTPADAFDRELNW
ncbi:MAG: NAD(P)-dependent oxidoreductase [Phycisphaera sp.]|nr:MAG: NAD(P)-dependent oxidoreductase [Phycisphaera sp.]